MKKVWIISAVVIAVLAVLGVAAFATYRVVHAQTGPTEIPGDIGRHGPRGMRGGMPGGRMMRGDGWMHDEMVAAFAEKLGMTAEDLQARLDAGDRLWDVAEEKGLTQEEFLTQWEAVRVQVIDQAVKDGKITQEQADRMKTRVNRRMDFLGGCLNGYGGSTPGTDATPAP